MTTIMRIKLKLLKKIMPWYALFFLFLFAIAAVFSMMVNAIVPVPILFVAFVCLRYKYNDKITYHADTTKKCIMLSILIFVVFSIPLILLNMKISLLASVPVAIAMTWLLYILGVKKQLEKELLSYKCPLFDLDNCTEEQLIKRCKERFTRDVEYKTERAIKHFILRLPHEEIDVNPEQSKKERYRMRKILQ